MHEYYVFGVLGSIYEPDSEGNDMVCAMSFSKGLDELLSLLKLEKGHALDDQDFDKAVHLIATDFKDIHDYCVEKRIRVVDQMDPIKLMSDVNFETFNNIHTHTQY